MKQYIILLLAFLFLSTNSDAQKGDIHVKSTIKSVIVYPNGAQISRQGSFSVPKGSSNLIIKNLPRQINLSSLQIKLPNDVELLSLTPKIDVGDILQMAKKAEETRNQIDKVKIEISRLSSKLVVLKDKESMLKKNDRIGGEQGISLEKLRSIVDYYQKQLTDIENQRIDIREKIKIKEKNIFELKQQLNKVNSPKSVSSLSLHLKVNTKQAGSKKIDISYTNAKAGWTPSYDFAIKSTSKPLEIKYNASIFQSTQEDWKNANIILSTSDLYRDKSIKELKPWIFEKGNQNRQTIKKEYQYGSLLGQVLDENNEPIKGAKITVKSNGKIIHQCFTSKTGRFKIKPLRMHVNYGVKIKSRGYNMALESLTANSENNIIILKKTNHLAQVKEERLDYEMMVEKINIKKKIELEEIQSLPTREISTISSGSMGSIYFVDGVKVNSRPNSYNEYQYNKKPQRKILKSQISSSKSTEESDFTYNLKEKMTILSDGEDYKIYLKTVSTPAEYEYISIPELKKIANLQVLLTDWETLQLQNAPVSYYYENRLVNQSKFVNQNFSDTLAIDFTEDDNIITRKKNNKLQESKKLFSGKITEIRVIELEVKNNKNTSVNVKLKDVLPTTEYEDIKIEILEISDQPTKISKDGIYHWKLQLGPKEKKIITYKYSVRYPKKMVD
jgi:hypothetical protein